MILVALLRDILVCSCQMGKTFNLVYYESRKRELKRRLINEGRCDERLKAKVEESTRLTYTVWCGEL